MAASVTSEPADSNLTAQSRLTPSPPGFAGGEGRERGVFVATKSPSPCPLPRKAGGEGEEAADGEGERVGAMSAIRFASCTATGLLPCMGGEKCSTSSCLRIASITWRLLCPTDTV